MKHVRVLSVASEIYPLIKTGGLADVIGALPIALKAENIETRTLVPGYPAVLEALEAADSVLHLPHFYRGAARVLAATAAGLDLFVLDAPHLFARAGNPYVAADGRDWPDNAVRFAALARIAADIALGAVPAFVPQVVQTHDWQAALTHAFLHYGRRPRPATVMTIHNMAFQGLFPRTLLNELGLPAESFAIAGLEYYGDIGFLKAGLQFADRITTVSPTYALEIQRPEAGMGLEGLLRMRSHVLSGILNGIDTAVWNPADDPRIPSPFSATALAARAGNKAVLQRRFGLPAAPDAFLLGVVSRLTEQKGLDLLLTNLSLLVGEGMQLALLGSGDAELQEGFENAARSHPDHVGTVIGYDEDLAHLVQAGADALVVPSRFEPCGLTQLCAMRYGAIPVVSRVGGLADTVIDANEMAVAAGVATGIQFGPVTSEDLAIALRRAAMLFRNQPVWCAMQVNGMTTDVSWRNPARHYAELCRQLAAI